MKARITINYILTVSIALFASALFAHVVPVHIKITENAADSALASSQPYASFLDVISSDITATDARFYLSEGSAREDDPVSILGPKDAGGYRSLNHFYDPLDNAFGKGLSDIPPDSRSLQGTNSFAWASISNSPGVPKHGLFPTNTWSWQNARYFEWAALTAPNQSDRIVYLTNMFRAVGQVMHLLEDVSQPQHARNEQHLDKIPIISISTPWRSAIEDYGSNHLYELNYQHDILDWRAAGFTKLEDFWDRHMYNGNGMALDADTNGGTSTLGLAEWCNGNFLGVRHLYPEYYTPTSIKYYPFPSRNTSTDYLEKKAHLASGVDTLTLRNGQQVKAIYLKKTNDGVLIDKHSRFRYFGGRLPGYGMITINDDNVLSNYHSIFIPKAIKFSAGLLDYYFRGTFEVAQATGLGGMSSVQIHNTSGQDFTNGAFHLYYDKSGGTRTELTGSDFSMSVSNIPVDSIVYANFNTNIDALNYTLVFQGTIGASNGTPLDPVDSGIAVAVKSFTNDLTTLPGPAIDFANLVWSSSIDALAIDYSFSGNTFSFNANNNAGWHLHNMGDLTYTGPGGAGAGRLHIVVRASTADFTASLTLTDVTDDTEPKVFSFTGVPVGTYDFSIDIPISSSTHYQVKLDAYAGAGGSNKAIDLTATLYP